MAVSQSSHSAHMNRLLAALPDEERERVLRHTETVSMEIKANVYEPNKPIEYIYFPHTGIASMLAVMEDNTLVEVGTVGDEGMVGIPVFLGADRTNGRSFWQVPGDAERMPSDLFREEVTRGGTLVRLLQRYTQALFVMLSQHTACNRIHSLEQRAARWLLMTHDRMHDDEFQLTQEFLSQMLGVRRAGVNQVMRQFQEAGFLTYRRGVITILDRAGLEAVVCECYWIVKDEYERMLDQKAPGSSHSH